MASVGGNGQGLERHATKGIKKSIKHQEDDMLNVFLSLCAICVLYISLTDIFTNYLRISCNLL